MQSWYFYYYTLGPIITLAVIAFVGFICYRIYKIYIKNTFFYQRIQTLIQHISVANDFLSIEQRTYLSIVVAIIILLMIIVNPWLITAIALFTSIVAVWAYVRGQDLRLISKRKYLLGVAGMLVWIVIFVQFRTVIGHSAGIGAITILIALKLFELDSRRDAIVLIFLSQMLVMGIFFFSQEIQDALVAIVIEILLVSAQAVVFQQYRTFWSNQFSIVKNSAQLIVISLIFGVIIFIFFPRPSEPLWSYGVPQNVSKSGLSDNMSPGSIDQLVLSNEVAFQVDFFNQNIPPTQERYWRGPVFANYSNGLWRRGVGEFAPVNISSTEIDKVKLSKPQSVKQYQIIIEPTYRKWVYALDTPVYIEPQARINSYGLVESNRFINSRKSFEIISITNYQHPIQKKLSLSDRINYTRIPTHSQNREPRLRSLVMQWLNLTDIDHVGTPLSPLTSQQALRIANLSLKYFNSQEFVYTLQPPKLTEINPNDNFLFDTRRGFCEHYSSAFTLLMRAAGIPARVVTGYQGGEINPLTGAMVVRQSDAHAWSEIWIEGLGWKRVDPTSAVAPERIERSLAESLSNSNELSLLSGASNNNIYRQLLFGWEAVRIQWNRWVILYDKESQFKLFANFSIPQLDTKQLLSIVIAVFLLFIGVAYIQNRPRKLQIKPTNKKLVDLIAKLQKRGIKIDNTLTLPEIYQRACEHFQAKKYLDQNQQTLNKKLKKIKVAINLIKKIKYYNLSNTTINKYQLYLKMIIRGI